jgi:hypothetical protein
MGFVAYLAPTHGYNPRAHGKAGIETMHTAGYTGDYLYAYFAGG